MRHHRVGVIQEGAMGYETINEEEEFFMRKAWDRTKRDIHRQYFFSAPYEIEVVERNLGYWLNSVREELEAGTYRPSPSVTIDIPKPGWHVRPGVIMSLKDVFVYQAIVLGAIDSIGLRLAWSADNKRFSGLLSDERYNNWFKKETQGWVNFQNRSIELIDSGNGYVVIADISAFFDNIDHSILAKDLLATGMDRGKVKLLMKCLKRWMHPRLRKGVPQSLCPSHVLAEIYLDDVDRSLNQAGYYHLRYVDDIRIFCLTEREAREAMRYLTWLLRERGLDIQSSKSRIITADEARAYIGETMSIVREIDGDFTAELLMPYGTTWEEQRSMRISHRESQLAAIRDGFSRHFADGVNFNSPLFHYLIYRLGYSRDSFAVNYCMRTLRERPEETRCVLNGYFSHIRSESLCDQLADYVVSGEIHYEYQAFLIMRWLFMYGIPTDRVLSAARQWVQPGASEYVRNYGFAILGEYGDETDLRMIRRLYDSLSSEVSKATAICALRRMTPHLRNSFYRSVYGKSWLMDQGIGWALSGASPRFLDERAVA